MQPKKKPYLSQELIQNFLDDLDDESFLGHEFVGDDGNIPPDDSDSSDDDLDPVETVHGDAVLEDVEETDMIIEEGNKDENVTADAEAEPLPRKQIFSMLNAVLDESRYDPLPPQNEARYTYSDAKKTIVMDWSTVKDNLLQCRQRGNILRNRPGPRGAARDTTTPLEAFQIFITDEMLDKIVRYTNASIEPFLEGNREILENANKYPFYKTVDVVDICAYFGILYIRSSLKVNLMDRETTWHHESANDMFEATMSLNRFILYPDF